ncbi:uncharacterized protein [Drosophila bipectinata]|uniref:uncharacterized protein n=1 Tax=Drosophila bipectinata TaxID=42026 RepID=UPI0038B3D0E5
MHSSIVFPYFWIIIFVYIGDIEAEVFRFSNVVCHSYNESWVLFDTCRLKAVSRERVLLNIKTNILHPTNDIKLHVKMWKKASGFKPWLLDSTVDCCRYMKKSYNPFANIVFNIYKDFSNLNHSCPYVGLQIVKDFYLRSELLRLPIPSGEYLISMQWFFYKMLQFDTNVTFLYLEDLIKRY